MRSRNLLASLPYRIGVSLMGLAILLLLLKFLFFAKLEIKFGIQKFYAHFFSMIPSMPTPLGDQSFHKRTAVLFVRGLQSF
jgi:hypothetical protein